MPPRYLERKPSDLHPHISQMKSFTTFHLLPLTTTPLTAQRHGKLGTLTWLLAPMLGTIQHRTWSVFFRHR